MYFGWLNGNGYLITFSVILTYFVAAFAAFSTISIAMAEETCVSKTDLAKDRCKPGVKTFQIGKVLNADSDRYGLVEGRLKIPFTGTSAQLEQNFKKSWNSFIDSDTYPNDTWTFHKRGCVSEIKRHFSIKRNCEISRMPDGKYGYKHELISDQCEEIACNPSWLDKLRY